MTELSALHVKIMGDAAGLNASLNTAQKGVESFSKNAEASARVFERAFAQNERAVDRLRQSIDPLYAASKRYEAALTTLDKALKSGSLSQAEHTRLVEQANAAYLRTGDAAAASTGRLGGAFGALGALSNTTRNRIQQVGFQLQDVAIQMQAGTRASVVFAQQGSQILSVFGPMGAVLGTLAAVGIPLAAAAFASAATETKSFKDAIDEANASINRLRETAAIFSSDGIQSMIDKYGELNGELLRHIELQRQADMRQAMEDTRTSMTALVGEMKGFEGALANIGDLFPEMGDEAFRLLNALERAASAKTTEGMLSSLTHARDLILSATGGIQNMTSEQFDFFLTVQKAEDALRLLNAEGARAQGWLSSAISGANDLASAFWKAAQAAAAARGAEATGQTKGTPLFEQGVAGFGLGDGLLPPSAGGAGGASGGGGANPILSQLESLRQSLLTQEQLQLESFTRQQEVLQAALDQRLITQQEYNELMKSTELQHAYEMADIKRQEADMIRASQADMYNELGGLLSAFGQKSKAAAIAAIALNKGLRIAEIIQNTAAAQMRAFAELGPIAGAAAAAKIAAMGKIQAGIVAATGLAQAAGGGRGGGGGASSAGAAAAPASNAGTYLTFNFKGNMPGQDEIGRWMVGTINKAIEDGSVIKGVRIA